MSTSAPGSAATSRYREIAADLRRQIESGELAPGMRVPSTRAIVDRWGVAMATATRVLTELRHQGLVRAVPGVGTVVEGGDRRPARTSPPQRRQGAPEGTLTSERIAAAGVAIADGEGLSAVSMRRVASELGVATMSLYRHVRDKDDLLLRMLDAVLGEWRLPEDPPAAWRPRVEIAARLFWDACRRHPWLAPALSITRPQPVAAGLPFAEFLLATLDGLGLDHQTTFTAYITLVNYVRGTAMNLEMEAEAEAATGVDNEEWLDAQEPALRAIVTAGRFPVFTRFISQEYDFSLDGLFEFGLGRLLDGLAALVAEGAPGRSGA
ncbi:MAG TPA: TetR/AcrR family transcriptional regulator C-terminal domain-containing protein [Terriglobales bacterium]|nr:TetR/AcrR family transcriptional regulator C-terminal domain-containing protein [Terriglobales bacterium]